VFRKDMLLLILFVLFLPAQAAAEIKRLAVLEFSGIGIDTNVLHKLSDQSRIASSNTLPTDQFHVMTRESMLEMLKDMGKNSSCLTGKCEIEIARNIGADYVITGDILQIEEIYFLTLKLHNSDTGQLLVGKEVKSDSLLELVKLCQMSSEELVRTGLQLFKTPIVRVPVKMKNSACPWGDTVTQANASQNNVTVNGHSYTVRTAQQQVDFIRVLNQCGKSNAVAHFQRWRNRRKSTIIWAASGVGTVYVAPWVGVATYNSRYAMVSELYKR
jgi:hypothetical protein